MNKKVLAAVIAVIIIIILGGGYFVFKKQNTNSPSPTPTENQVSQNTNPTSLKELLSLGTSQKCTYDMGTVYVSDGKVRGDFSSVQDGQTVTSHMITMDNTNYIWTDGQSTGFKVTFDPNATPAPITEATPSQTEPAGGVDINQQVNYTCSAWSPDASYFELPNGVTFSDFSNFLKQIQSSGSAPPIPEDINIPTP